MVLTTIVTSPVRYCLLPKWSHIYSVLSAAAVREVGVTGSEMSLVYLFEDKWGMNARKYVHRDTYQHPGFTKLKFFCMQHWPVAFSSPGSVTLERLWLAFRLDFTLDGNYTLFKDHLIAPKLIWRHVYWLKTASWCPSVMRCGYSLRVLGHHPDDELKLEATVLNCGFTSGQSEALRNRKLHGMVGWKYSLYFNIILWTNPWSEGVETGTPESHSSVLVLITSQWPVENVFCSNTPPQKKSHFIPRT